MSIFYSDKLTLAATAASGIEAVLKRELQALGYEPSPADNGRIEFTGSMADVARCNVRLRTSDRVYVKLHTCEANTFDELFDGVSAVAWEDILPKDARLIINAKSAASALFALSAIQSISKKAIVNRLTAYYKVSQLPEDGAEYRININLYKNRAVILLDTSGVGLNKRGYRAETGEAPIRETLAAAIILLSVWKWDRPLIDPFTGSGTIPIEAALIATNTAPNLNRSFAFENYTNAPYTADLARDEAKQLIIRDRELRISGFDINDAATKLAVRHAKLAGVDEYIHFQTADMRTLSSRFTEGTIITNPPYGERLMTESEVVTLYRDFGKAFRSLDNWNLYVITAYGNFERVFGRRADKNRKLFNSQLECRLYQYLSKR